MRDGRPWGLSGPEFLELYGLALVALVGLCLVVQLARRTGPVSGHAKDEHDNLGLYERAFLNGGPNRVADTALAVLLDGRKVRVNRQQQVTVEARTADDEFQQRALDSVRGRTEVVGMVRVVRRSVRRSGRCRPVARALRERGLLVPLPVRWLVLVLRILFPLLLAVGAVRAVHGAVQGYPIGYLLVELVVTGVAWWCAAKAFPHPRRTAAGEALRRSEATSADDLVTWGAGLPTGQAASRVAERGLGDHPDARMARVLAKSTNRDLSGGGGFGRNPGGGGGSGAGGGFGGGGCGGGGA